MCVRVFAYACVCILRLMYSAYASIWVCVCLDKCIRDISRGVWMTLYPRSVYMWERTRHTHSTFIHMSVCLDTHVCVCLDSCILHASIWVCESILIFFSSKSSTGVCAPRLLYPGVMYMSVCAYTNVGYRCENVFDSCIWHLYSKCINMSVFAYTHVCVRLDSCILHASHMSMCA